MRRSAYEMYVRFWGVRGSIPVSNPGCVRSGGNTACVEVRCGQTAFIFDAGSGLRELGAALVEEGRVEEAPVEEDLAEVDLFLSHGHVDHLLGLPFFAFAFRAGNRLRLWSGRHSAGGGTERMVRSLMGSPLAPVGPEAFAADVTFCDFRPGRTLHPQPGVAIRTAPLRHPGGATGYRIDHAGRSVCYVTDTEHEPGTRDRNVAGLIDGADVVIYDAMFTDEELPRHRGWGHSTWQEGARLCRAAGVGTYVIFHHAPERDDDALDAIEGAARRLFAGAVVAREGLTLSL